MPNDNKHKPWLAACLSLLLPGLGHVYLSEYWAALLGLLGTVGLLLAGLFLTLGTAQGLFMTLGAAACWELAVAADACRRARRASARPEAWALKWPALLPLALGANLFMTLALSGPLARHARYCLVEVTSRAMEPSLRLGDKVVVDMGRRGHQIRLQDRILLEDPDDSHESVASRCVALAGDWVEIRDQGFYRNGLLQERWTLSTKEQDLALSKTFAPMFRYGPARIPEGNLFCLGDNRGNAMDSRMWGPIREDAVKGRILYTCLNGPKAPPLRANRRSRASPQTPADPPPPARRFSDRHGGTCPPSAASS